MPGAPAPLPPNRRIAITERIGVHPQPGYEIEKYERNWMVIAPAGQLVCITVYKKEALEVVRRLAVQQT